MGRHGTGSGGGGGDGTGSDGGAGGGNGVVYIAYDTADAVTDTESATVAATGGALLTHIMDIKFTYLQVLPRSI